MKKLYTSSIKTNYVFDRNLPKRVYADFVESRQRLNKKKSA